MAAVHVPMSAFREGDLPRTCARTGGPADRLASAEASRVPGWTWILLLFGVLPFLVVVFFARERVVGWVPMSDHHLERLHSLRKRRNLALWGAGVALAVGALTGAEPAVWLGVASLLAGVGVGTFAMLLTVGGRPVGDEVRLTNVHPRFAEAVPTGSFVE